MKILNAQEDTLALGKKIGQALLPGDILLLQGDLGAGKTTLTQGIAEGLKVAEFVNSPTFVIINEYYSGRLPLYHMDLYRLEDEAQLYDLGIEEYFFGNGVSIVEWPDIAMPLLPDTYAVFVLSHTTEGRMIDFIPHGDVNHIEDAFNEHFGV